MTLFVVGNITEDVIFGLPRLPRGGETLIADSRISDIGGKGLNQALLAARSGMPVRLIAPVGRDDAGRRAQELTAGEPLEAVLLEKDCPTDQSIIAVAQCGENYIISSAFAASALSATDVVAAAAGASPGDHLLMQGNMSQETTQEILQWARGLNLFTTVNPSPIRWNFEALWPYVNRLVLNTLELATLSGHLDLDRGIEALSAKGVDEIVVTRGADGAMLSSVHTRCAVPAAPATVVDTAGAGDTFCGVFVAALHQGHDHGAAMSIAARAAAITIGRSGTFSAFPSTAELAEIFQSSEKG